MPIILEGPDGGGKTSFITKIVEVFGLEVMPRVVGTDTQPLVDLKAWVEEDNQRPDHEPLLYDRHRLVSEAIYGPILRLISAEGFDDLKWMRKQILRFYNRKPLLIYCLPPLASVYENLRYDSANLVVFPKIPQIYSAYTARYALDSTLWPRTIRLDYTQGVVHKNAVLNTIGLYLKEQ